jgi:chemotaxis signal transduction protein
MVTAHPTNTPAELVKVSVGPFAVGLPMSALIGVERGDRVQPSSCPGDAGRLVNRTGEYRVRQLAQELGGSHTRAPRTGQVALVQSRGERFGLWADRVAPISRSSSVRAGGLPVSFEQGCFSGVVLLDDGPLLILDIDRLLGKSNEPAPRRTHPTRIRNRFEATTRSSSRILVVGSFEYPAPGGRPVGFGISEGCVEELTDISSGTTVPGAPPHIVGLIEWRGRAVPKIDPAVWCGFEHRTLETARVVMVRIPSGEQVAVAAGSGVRVMPISTPHTAARLKLPLVADHVHGSYEFPNFTLVLPNWEGVA